MSRNEYNHHYGELLESRQRQIDEVIEAVCAEWQVEDLREREEKRQCNEAAEAARR